VANTIRIKRRAGGGATGAPTSLANAELAYNESDAGNGVLYYGYGTGGASGTATQVVAIGGDGAFVSITGNQSISGNKSFSGQVNLSSATVSGFAISGNLTVNGNFTVSGTTTFVNSQTVEVQDKNLELGKVSSPSDVTADGGGISLLGDTTKTIAWVNATDAWTLSEHLDIANGKSYRVNGLEVLSASALGSGITSSSLTSLGTVTTGTWSAGTIAVNKGGTGATDAETARANLGLAIGTNVQAYDIELAAIAGLTSATDKLPYFTGSGTASLADFSGFGRSLVDDVDASAARTTLGLGTMATQAASNVAITGGTINGVEIDGGSY
jgi:hypothetical protein